MRTLPLVLPLALVLAACTESTFSTNSCDDVDGACEEYDVEDIDALVDRTNTLENGLTIILGEGNFMLDNQLTLRGASDISLIGQGMDLTVIDLAPAAASQVNGVDSVGDGFLIQDLTIQNATKDALRVEDSSNIIIRRVRTTWSAGPSSENGAYGIYPVRVDHVLVEDSEALNASDAGLYVGQCQHAVIRNNHVEGNVAGLEIENTQYADVYGNMATDNTAGIVIFDLPGNPIVGRDVYVHDNMVIGNNRATFAPSGIVRSIPAGTGTFMLASRRVHLTNNTWEDNDSVAVAVLSGLAIESDPASWAIQTANVLGDVDDLALMTGEGVTFNFRSENVLIEGNTFVNNGTSPDTSDAELRELGLLLGLLYGDATVDSVVYDGIGESSFSNTDASAVSNDNQVCIGANEGTSVVNLNLAELLATGTVPTLNDVFQPAAPFAPYDCTDLAGGAVVLGELPAGINE
jgi:parallel beta-helix repeat protein